MLLHTCQKCFYLFIIIKNHTRLAPPRIIISLTLKIVINIIGEINHFPKGVIVLPAANPATYLEPVLDALALKYPDNKIINMVCHGHSVPAGYFATPFVNAFSSYPHFVHKMIAERFPFAVANVIVTGIGGENPINGAKRFERDVLNHNPEIVSINYGLRNENDSDNETGAWREMIEKSLKRDIKIILVTPIWNSFYYTLGEKWDNTFKTAEAIRSLADEYETGLADAFAAFERYINAGGNLANLLSHVNHPTETGHRLIADEFGKYFIAR